MILEYAAPLLADGGHVVAWKGAVAEPRRPPRAAAAAAILGLEPLPVARRRRRIPGARDHTLHAFRKIAPTPDRFPRRPGHGHEAPARNLITAAEAP